jgi:hypothetical protein
MTYFKRHLKTLGIFTSILGICYGPLEAFAMPEDGLNDATQKSVHHPNSLCDQEVKEMDPSAGFLSLSPTFNKIFDPSSESFDKRHILFPQYKMAIGKELYENLGIEQCTRDGINLSSFQREGAQIAAKLGLFLDVIILPHQNNGEL